MFSFFGGKKKHSPDDSADEAPPIQGPEDDFTMINSPQRGGTSNNGASLYPHFGQGGTVTYPSQPNQPAVPPRQQKPVHYLQGVPFTLSKELAASTNSDTAAVQISSIMAYITRGLHIDSMDYDFSIEKSVALEG